MDCSTCGHHNSPDARFCARCGIPTQITCPVCSFPSPADANFCSNCGNSLRSEQGTQLGRDVTQYVPPEMLAKIDDARTANPMRGERRTVTMLFADIQGSTAAAEGLDPEDWTDIVNGAFEHLISPVYRYEGTLARLLGDAVLAFFGAPIAHEDDPVRAVRAGLEMVEAMEGYKAGILARWGIPIDVRVGINTGLVVVGEVGSDLRVEYTALGDAVNVAARMEQTAEPGTVRVTSDTWELLRDHFDGVEIGPVEVKGKSDPVAAVRVLGIRSGDGPLAGDRPLVGRDAELGQLEDLGRHLADGAGWVASVMGEAGLGKSRLLEAFRERIEGAGSVALDFRAPGNLAWMSALNESYDASVPYSSLRQLLGRWWRLEGADDPFGLVEEATAAVLTDPGDTATYLAYVVSVPLPGQAGFLDELEPPVLHARVRSAVASYLEAECLRRPVLVSVEDLHWADPMSLTLIEDLMQLAEKVPLGVLATMRPYRYEPPWRVHEVAQRDHADRYHHLDLASLGGNSASELLDAFLDGEAVDSDLRRRILERSDGNPLFLEQMARALREGGGDTDGVTVPTGLSSLLTARLDRLDSESKMVVQIASVMGSEVDRSTLASLVGDQVDLDRRLADLLAREIFVERRNRPDVVAFHHALMQDAAYSTMLLRTRRDLHGRLARYLAHTTPDSVQEIALHFLEAQETEQAFPYLVEAGERSSRSMALSDAIQFFTTALENIPAGAEPELIVRAHDGLGVAYTLVPDLTQSEATYQLLVDYADSSGRPSAKVMALNRLGMTTAMLGGDLMAARGYLDQAYQLAREAGDEFGLAQYHMNACTIAGMGGDLATSVDHDAETARWGQELGVDEIRVEGLTRLAENTMWLMDFERAVPAFDEAIEAAREVGNDHSVAILQALAGSRLRLRDGDTEAALRSMLDHEATMERYASFFLPLSQGMAGILQFESGAVEAARTRLQSARDHATAAHMPFFEALASAALARIYASVGMEKRMEAARAAAVEAVNSSLGDFVASTVWTELGHAALAVGDLEQARADLDTGLAATSATQYWEKPRLLLGRALVDAALGDAAGAHSSVDEAQTFLLQKEMRTYDAHLEYARAEAFLAEGKTNAAAERLVAAAELAAGRWRLLALEISTRAARVASHLGDDEAARHHLSRARQEVVDMAAAVTDPELRAAMESAWSEPLDQAPIV